MLECFVIIEDLVWQTFMVFASSPILQVLDIAQFKFIIAVKFPRLRSELSSPGVNHKLSAGAILSRRHYLTQALSRKHRPSTSQRNAHSRSAALQRLPYYHIGSYHK